MQPAKARGNAGEASSRSAGQGGAAGFARGDQRWWFAVLPRGPAPGKRRPEL